MLCPFFNLLPNSGFQELLSCAKALRILLSSHSGKNKRTHPLRIVPGIAGVCRPKKVLKICLLVKRNLRKFMLVSRGSGHRVFCLVLRPFPAKIPETAGQTGPAMTTAPSCAPASTRAFPVLTLLHSLKDGKRIHRKLSYNNSEQHALRTLNKDSTSVKCQVPVLMALLLLLLLFNGNVTGRQK